ncbi:hypothetical protein [Methanoregula sp.]|jgi:hypothetical protein|uniref:hypothetical protein n=1 Tax=Methanoregula sp. TaxID=2052170 RepID=UPI00356976BF
MKPGINTVILLALVVVLSLPASAGLTVVTSGPQTIAKADTVTLTGTDAQNGSVALWIVGRNYFDTKTVTPDKKGNFTFVIKPEESNKFSSGEYAFLIQDPGADKRFEIAPLLWSDGIRIADNGKVITNIGLESSFRADIGPVAATIINISGEPGVDDIFTPYYFYVEEPHMRFNRVSESSGTLPDQTTGEALLITGTTNVGPENLLKVEIRNATSNDLITSQTIPVETGTNTNQWTYALDAPGLPAGSYIVTIGEQKYTTSGNASAQITILEYRMAGTISQPLQPELPGGESSYGLILPLIISFAALVIIGIIMLVSLRK